MERRQGKIVVARGLIALEARLVADLEGMQRGLRSEILDGAGPVSPIEPLRVLVSSAALRVRLAARIAAAPGSLGFGVAVGNVWNAAREVLARAGVPVPSGGPLFEVFVRRAAQAEDRLSTTLGGLEDGHGIVSSTIRDLLNARFEPEDLPALEAVLEELPPGRVRDRSLSVLSAAARTARSMAGAGVGRIGDVLERATERLRALGPDALPSRAVLVHGFADAPGRVADFLAALLEVSGATVYVDEPPDPVDPARPDRGARFREPFLRALLAVAPREDDPAAGEPPEIELFHASGADAEAREIADRVRALLDEGVRPEEIGVVARTLDAYAVPLRRHFDGLGIPYSGGLAPAGLFPLRRRFEAVLEILRRGADVPIDRWIDALGAGFEEERLALRSIGAGRLSEAAAIDPALVLRNRAEYPLPTRRGFEAIDEPGEDGEAEGGGEGDGESSGPSPSSGARKRALPAATLEECFARARRLWAWLASWPDDVPLARHVEWFAELLETHLGWRTDPGGGAPAWREAARALAGLAPQLLTFSFEEFLLLLGRETESLHVGPLGGRGAGVQVLDVAHARGLTFDRLFLAGLERDVFPRPIREDPFLPDAARRRLSTRLPALALARAGFDEERFLFAELLTAAPRVSISWQRSDEDGRLRNPSPLVERLRMARPDRPEASVPRLREDALADAARRGRPLTARDAALLTALVGSRAEFAESLGTALAGSGSPDPALAAARFRILEWYDPDLSTPEGRSRAARPGPWYGLVAPLVPRERDPRHAPLFVTTLESLARCPWQTFLLRILRLEPSPDPLAGLPSLDASMIGRTVHQALQDLMTPWLPSLRFDLPAAIEGGPVPVPRPEDVKIEAAVDEAARRVGRDSAIHLPGLVRALADLALPFVRTAIEVDWPAGDAESSVLGTELRGWVVLRSGRRSRKLQFLADRADRLDGRLRLTDYKTGRPLSSAKKPETRAHHLAKIVARGHALQAAAYSAAFGAGAVGRYLYLDPELEPDVRSCLLEGSDAIVAETFPTVAVRLLEAWERGLFFPRLEEAGGNEPAACRRCVVSEACLRGDSGARRRLTALVESQGSRAAADMQRLAALWRLGQESPPEENERASFGGFAP